jgi:hypothetical protein
MPSVNSYFNPLPGKTGKQNPQSMLKGYAGPFPGTSNLGATAQQISALSDPFALAIAKKYAPQWSNLQTNLLTSTAKKFLPFETNTVIPTANKAITDTANAFVANDPFLSHSLTRMDEMGAHGFDQDPLAQAMNTQAIEGINAGGALTPDAMRQVQQASRAGFAARGMAMGNPAILDEVANADRFRQQRLAAAQAFAGQVEGQNQNLTGMKSTFATTAPGVAESTTLAPAMTATGPGGLASWMSGFSQYGQNAMPDWAQANPYQSALWGWFGQQSAQNAADSQAAAARNASYINSGISAVGNILSNVKGI